MPGDNQNQQRNVKTIGLFLGNISDGYNYPILFGVNQVAQTEGVNVLCFMGNTLNSPDEFERRANIIYELADPQNIDGLIITGSLTVFDKNQQNFARYRSMPLVAITMELEGIPAVRVDNEPGFRALLEHLINEHGYHRLAYIGGPIPNVDSEQRYRIYQEVLMENGIALDQELVTAGLFHLESTGNDAVKELLDQRQVQFDAIVCANDILALGALSELRSRKLPISNELAVTGFDDQEWTKYYIRPVTTVRQSSYDLGRCGARLLLAQLAGEKVPEQVLVPTELVVRNSCGCFSPKVIRAAIENEMVLNPRPDSFAEWQKRVIPLMEKALGPSTGIPGWAESLTLDFWHDLQNGDTGLFLKSLRAMIQRTIGINQEVSLWQDVISAMQQPGLNSFSSKQMMITAENIWHQARILIGEICVQIENHQCYMLLEHLLTLNHLTQSVGTAFNDHNINIIDTLVAHLSALGIQNCYLALYEGTEMPFSSARLLLAVEDTERLKIDPEGIRFPIREIIPESLLSHKKWFSLGVFPLYFERDQLGYILLDVLAAKRFSNKSHTYEILCGAISSSLKGSLLVKALKQKEKELQERTSELVLVNKELEQFAYVASNDLLEPLRMVRGYLQLLEKRYRGKLDRDADEFIGFAVDGAARMHNLINDLLMYARVGSQNKPFEPVDINKIIAQALLNLKIAIEEHQAKINVELMPVITADPGQMVQLFQNLIGNAIKFHGESFPEIRISAVRQNEYWRFSVQDNGIGLDMEHAERIFQIFHRLHSKDEYPGTGIGLSVCQKIVEHHGGRIWVESKPGKGSIFHFTIRTGGKLAKGGSNNELSQL